MMALQSRPKRTQTPSDTQIRRIRHKHGLSEPQARLVASLAFGEMLNG